MTLCRIDVSRLWRQSSLENDPAIDIYMSVWPSDVNINLYMIYMHADVKEEEEDLSTDREVRRERDHPL